MHRIPSVSLALFCLVTAPGARAQDAARIEAGSKLYADTCSECHGPRLNSTGAAFDLRELGADERPRFDKSVMEGKNQMPAWRGTLQAQDLDTLWAYIRSRANN